MPIVTQDAAQIAWTGSADDLQSGEINVPYPIADKNKVDNLPADATATINALQAQIDVLSALEHPLPAKANEAAINSSYPSPDEGDYCKNFETDTFWMWDAQTAAWVDTGAGASFSGNSDDLTEGTVKLLLTVAERAQITKNVKPLNNIAFLGDSRAFYGRRDWIKNASISSGGAGLGVIPMGTFGEGVLSDSTGLLEYRAVDKSLRWTAPGDTAGPWYAMSPGIMMLDSGALDSVLQIGVRRSNQPVSDTTANILVSGTPYPNFSPKGMLTWVMRGMLFNLIPAHYGGIGGSLTPDLVEQLPWHNAQSYTPGFDVIRVGTNDITNNNITASAMAANVQTVIDSRLALGRKIVLCNEGARWGTSVGTPLVSAQKTTLLQYNELLAEIAAADANIRLVDIYSMTYDPGYTDARPKSGYLADTVHDSPVLAKLIGDAIITEIKEFGASVGTGSVWGASSNLFPEGYLLGSDTPAGAGASGVEPIGWNILRAAGADLTIAGSYTDRPAGGKYFKTVINTVTSGQIFEFGTGTKTIGALGLNIGDLIYIEVEVKIAIISGSLASVIPFIYFFGATPTRWLMAEEQGGSNQLTGSYLLRSPVMAVPAGTTSLKIYVYGYPGATSQAEVSFYNARVAKV